MWLNKLLYKIRTRLGKEDGAVLILICVFTVVAAFAAVMTGYVAQLLIARAKLAGATQATARAMTEGRDWFDMLVSRVEYGGGITTFSESQIDAKVRTLLSEQGVNYSNGFTVARVDCRYATTRAINSYMVPCFVYDRSVAFYRFSRSRSYDSLLRARHNHPFFTVRVTVNYQTMLGTATFTVTKSAEMQELPYTQE